MENLAGKKIKVLRSENGGEYTSIEYKDFYKDAGIKKENTVAYNPQQNGVAERKNKYIISYVKAMIHDQSFSLFLWARKYNTVIYLQIKSSHKVFEDKA